MFNSNKARRSRRGKGKSSLPHAGTSRGKGKRNTANFDQYIAKSVSRPLQPVKGPVLPTRELKYVDTAGAAYEASTTGSITLLNPIAEGGDNTNRSGREVLIKDVSVTGYLQATATTPAVGSACRIMLVWDNACNGALATILNVLTAVNPISFPNVDNVARFTILMDKKFIVGSPTATTTWQPIVYVDETVSVNSAVRFSGTTAAIGSIQNGALLLITTGNLVTGATAPVLSADARVTFHDSE